MFRLPKIKKIFDSATKNTQPKHFFSKKRKIFLTTQIGCAVTYLFCGENVFINGFGDEQNEQERPAGNKKCKLFGH